MSEEEWEELWQEKRDENGVVGDERLNRLRGGFIVELRTEKQQGKRGVGVGNDRFSIVIRKGRLVKIV